MADPIQSDPVSGVSPAQFTRRAVLTGMTLGALLVPCNVYSGLKIGWSFNMSIAAALLSLGFWRMMRRTAMTQTPIVDRSRANMRSPCSVSTPSRGMSQCSRGRASACSWQACATPIR